MLDAVIADIRGGGSRCLVLRGEAGIGKTALLGHLVESASGVTIVQAVGIESEMELPFASLHQVCDVMLDRLPMLPAPQRQALGTAFGLTPGQAPDGLLVGLATLSLFSEVATTRPLLCVIDDAQWLDRASAVALAFVARRLRAERVGIVFAAREPGPELRDLPALEVCGLGEDDARALLALTGRAELDTRVRDRIIAETRGNPLALVEVPQGLTATQLADGFDLLVREDVSGHIQSSFVRRLHDLSDDGRRLVLIAAADPVGDAMLLWRAAQQAGIPLTAAEEPQVRGLLTIDERVRFRHPLARSAVYRSATGTDRRAAHMVLAQVTDRTVDPDRRAWHLAAATKGPDEDVAAELQQSATRAQARGGFAAAAALLQRAVTLTDDPARRGQRALAAAEATMQAGDFADAASLLAIARAGPLDGLQEARAELLLGQQALLSTFGNEALPWLLKAARRLERLDADMARDTYLDAWGAALISARLSTGGGLLEVSRAAKSVLRSHAARRTCDLLLEALATLVADGRGPAAPLLEAVTRTYVSDPLPPDSPRRSAWLAVVPTYALWDEESTYAICEQQLLALRRAGALAELPVHLGTFALLATRCGEFATAEKAIAESAALAEATGTMLTSHLTMTLEVFRGREAQARTAIHEVRESVSGIGRGVALEMSEWLFALLCNAHGRYKEAATARDLPIDDPEELFVSTWTAIELLEAACKRRDAAAAAVAFERVAAATAFTTTESARGILARSQALVSDGEEAERLYEQAIEHLGRTRLRPDLARAHLLYGEWLLAEDRRGDARPQLRAAHDLLTAIGMEGFAERARNDLSAAGDDITSPAAVHDDLTAQERQIARLARDGLPNSEIGARLFLSPRTVEWHLRKVFAKLGIRSRRELRTALPAPDAELPAA